MSYPHQVPKGWVKGEALRVWGSGPRYGITIAPAPNFMTFMARLDAMDPEDLVMIQFDSRADLDAFLQWWNA